jgi:hypothetical protein
MASELKPGDFKRVRYCTSCNAFLLKSVPDDKIPLFQCVTCNKVAFCEWCRVGNVQVTNNTVQCFYCSGIPSRLEEFKYVYGGLKTGIFQTLKWWFNPNRAELQDKKSN